MTPPTLQQLLAGIRELKALALGTEKKHRRLLAQVHPDYLPSARNLLHYLALRSVDLRKLQESLSGLAISSLTHSEGYTLENLTRIEALLQSLAGHPPPAASVVRRSGRDESRVLMQAHTEALFGPEAFPGHTRLMVTLPSEAADDPFLVRSLVQDGMQVARINTAHDGPDAWAKMVRHVRKASRDTGKRVLLYMDLAGPKIRTGEVIHGGHNGKDHPKQVIHVRKGTRILFSAAKHPKPRGADAVMRVTLPVMFRFVQKGDPVSLDDGKFSGRVLESGQKHMLVEIRHVPVSKSILRPEKGINLPETDLRIPSLSAEDRAVLPFMAKHADMLGFSFVRHVRDITGLQKALLSLGRPDIGLILKIENRAAFENMPKLMLAAMRHPRAGIMIARGDLAVEVGFMRIAEVQEEILWLAEAAHMPVIWATEILDNLVKKGKTTRAEISDAVKSVRAECAMLNKGPFIADGLRMLKDIDIRMAAHEDKKMKTLRSLHVAFKFVQ
jgi:pyruvate kinase